MTKRLLGGLLLVAFTLATAPLRTTHAQVVPPTITNERARAHFELAVGYFETAEYDEALREFERAYELSHQADILYNLHLVHERMGNLDRAVDTLERYLAEAAAVEDRPTLEARLRSLRDRLARSREQQTGAGTPTGQTTPRPAGSGETARSGGAAGGRTGAQEDAGGGTPVGAIVSFSVAGAGAIAFGVFGALALGEDAEVYDYCGEAGDCDAGDVSGIRTLSLAADIGLGVAVVGAAVGVILLVTSGGRDEHSRDALRIVPTMGPRAAGATVGVRF